MTNPTTTMQAMPTMPGEQALPTATPTYQTLLENMLANESKNPMAGWINGLHAGIRWHDEPWLHRARHVLKSIKSTSRHVLRCRNTKKLRLQLLFIG
jgi:hypothetical protein